MNPILFEFAIVERKADGALVLAFFDGSLLSTPTSEACVALLECSIRTARALGSALEHALTETRGDNASD